MQAQQQLNLKGMTFQDLFTHDGLKRLDDQFLDYLQVHDAVLAGKLQAFRRGDFMKDRDHSEFLISVAVVMDHFISELWSIQAPVFEQRETIQAQDPIFAFKKQYILKLAKRKLHQASDALDFIALDDAVTKLLAEFDYADADRELAIAKLGQQLQTNPEVYDAQIALLTDWCVAALVTETGKAAVRNFVSFHQPAKLHYENLVDVVPLENDPFGRLQGPPEKHRQRDGFTLTDPRMRLREVLDEIHYCVYCHKNQGDFCSKGFPVKKNEPELGLKINPTGETLTGCPLEEKISEMHTLKKNAFSIGALAMVMADNPMCAATGHRICNDCMKACIYQKQAPVDIPQIETRVLTDVLSLPWGVEIYDLLTRWNPLRDDQYLIQPYNGLKVLVMGMGPAGFTLAHHLTMAGCAVVGTDGLKIEPLDRALLEQPIYRFDDLKEQLDDRIMAGFGGVAEYGITVRWDKNFLKLIYICLMRRRYFQVFGSVRFGGTLTVEDAWQLGFDHMALAVGAGLPRELHIPNSLAPGMRQANDFLMALQLTGAAKQSSLANLQIRLPAVVIGGGLTGVDTATEIQAYYINQVEKVLARYETLCVANDEATVRSRFTQLDLTILDEFLAHGRRVREERAIAAKEQRKPDFIRLLRAWGGVSIVYRKSMQESPAYKRNHEELNKALEEGIYYAEGLEPKAVVLDEYGQVNALACRWRVQDADGEWMFTDEEQVLPTRSILVATGAKPNVAYAFEHRGTLERQKYEYERFAWVDGELLPIRETGHVKMPEFGAFTNYQEGHRHVSFLGDTHPIFHGSVVKAIASAKRAYPKIMASLAARCQRGDEAEFQTFKQQMQSLFAVELLAVKQHREDVFELCVKAPMAAQHCKPGQFYRVQNYECDAALIDGTKLQTEAMALLGIKDHQHADRLRFMILKRGVSSRIATTFTAGQRLAVMGPTGVATKILANQTVMIVGGELAIPYLLSVAPALKEAGNRVIFLGTFARREDIYLRDEIEQWSDQIIWHVNEGDKIIAARMQDISFSGELITELRDYLNTKTHEGLLKAIHRVEVIGYAGLLKSSQKARQGLLKAFINPETLFTGSVYGPMQCMLKGVCAQCLQWQIDPVSGKRTKAVYACSWQQQPMEIIDLGNLEERLSQNGVQENLSEQWLSYLQSHVQNERSVH